VQRFLGAVLCCILFGVDLGGVAAFMNVFFIDALGVDIVQVGKNWFLYTFLVILCTGHYRFDVSLHSAMVAPYIGLLRKNFDLV
jgi:hypothetical protein